MIPPSASRRRRCVVIPAASRSSNSALAPNAASSSGVMNLENSCVPGGTHPATRSAASMAVAYALAVRLMVEKITAPPGLASPARHRTNPSGSATCSITSNDSTASKVSAVSRSVSAGTAR